MRRTFGAIAALALCAVLATSAAQAAPRKHAAVNLTFATYVWQPTTVAAVKSIVDSAFRRTVNLLRAQREVLERGARLLLEKETLDEADLLALHAAEPVVGAEPAG